MISFDSIDVEQIVVRVRDGVKGRIREISQGRVRRARVIWVGGVESWHHPEELRLPAALHVKQATPKAYSKPKRSWKSIRRFDARGRLFKKYRSI